MKRLDLFTLAGVALLLVSAAWVSRRGEPAAPPAVPAAEARRVEEDFLNELAEVNGGFVRELEAAAPEDRPAVWRRQQRAARAVYARHGKRWPLSPPG